jgi:hypothetical protein
MVSILGVIDEDRVIPFPQLDYLPLITVPDAHDFQ